MLRKDPFVNGNYYHIYNRGIDKRIIFKSAVDHERFLMLLYICNTQEYLRLDNILSRGNKKLKDVLVIDKGDSLVSVGAWCLMPNHFHLLIRQEKDGGITKFMKKVGTAYSMYFNSKYKRQGSLFGGLFKSKLIGDNDKYLRHLFGYIHLNPLELKFPNWDKNFNVNKNDMSIFLSSYLYSSYFEYTGKDRVEKIILNSRAFPDYFENTSKFEKFVESYLCDREL